MAGRNGYDGPSERRIVVDPRAAFRARKLTDDDPITAPPPSLLPDDEDPDRRAVPFGDPAPHRWSLSMLQHNLVPTGYSDDEPDPLMLALRLRLRPGHRPNRMAAVRVYHRLEGAPDAGSDGRCWAFTITRVAYERLVMERVLDSEGATYPMGERVVPPGVDPLYVPIRCGSCGTQSVSCLQMEFWQD